MREPRGKSTGGQFTARANPESAVVFDTPDGEMLWDIEFTRGFSTEHAIVKAASRDVALEMVRESFGAFDNVSFGDDPTLPALASDSATGPRHDLIWPNGEKNRSVRGHDFLSEKSLDRIPDLYDTEEIAMCDKVIFEHYFIGHCNWYVAEVDRVTGTAFGYCDLGDRSREWGYVNLVELEEVIDGSSLVKRQTDFVPATAMSLGLVEG